MLTMEQKKETLKLLADLRSKDPQPPIMTSLDLGEEGDILGNKIDLSPPQPDCEKDHCKEVHSQYKKELDKLRAE